MYAMYVLVIVETGQDFCGSNVANNHMAPGAGNPTSGLEIIIMHYKSDEK